MGHFLDLLDLLTIKDDAEFRQRFEKSAVRRPKRRGLLRNGLVVLGNHLRNGHKETDRIVSAVAGFAQDLVDPMLVEHSAWALSQCRESAAIKAVNSLALAYAATDIGPILKEYLATSGALIQRGD